MDISLLPLKSTPAICLVVANIVAVSANTAPLGFQLDNISILFVPVLFVNCDVFNIVIKDADVGVDAVADISGDVVTLPVVIVIPVPAVGLKSRLKYGIAIEIDPSNTTPAIFLAETNFIAASAILAVVGFQLTSISILLVPTLFTNYVVLNIPIVFADVNVACFASNAP